jgi:hypothetical protein
MTFGVNTTRGVPGQFKITEGSFFVIVSLHPRANVECTHGNEEQSISINDDPEIRLLCKLECCTRAVLRVFGPSESRADDEDVLRAWLAVSEEGEDRTYQTFENAF